MEFHYGAKCGDCVNCGLKRVDIPSELIPCVYSLYCVIDNRELGSLHNTRAELCKHFKERENQICGYNNK